MYDDVFSESCPSERKPDVVLVVFDEDSALAMELADEFEDEHFVNPALELTDAFVSENEHPVNTKRISSKKHRMRDMGYPFFHNVTAKYLVLPELL